MSDLNNLKHKYFAIRHGNSISNEKDILVGSIANGINLEYGLTDLGKKQVQISSELFKAQVKYSVDEIILIHSPFSRTLQTAKIIEKEFKTNTILENYDLVEREFGGFELADAKTYNKIWEKDYINPDSTFANSESINSIKKRMLNVIDFCENLKLETGQKIFLITHADSARILETAFRKIPVQNHRDIPYIRNAEIRALN